MPLRLGLAIYFLLVCSAQARVVEREWEPKGEDTCQRGPSQAESVLQI